MALAACSGPEKKSAASAPPQPDSTEPAPTGNLPTPKPQELVVNGVRIIPARSSGIAVEPLPRTPGRGELILHGGGRFGAGHRPSVVALAGPDPRLCLIDTADIDRLSIERLFDAFRRVSSSPILDLRDRGRGAAGCAGGCCDKCTGLFLRRRRSEAAVDTFCGRAAATTPALGRHPPSTSSRTARRRGIERGRHDRGTGHALRMRRQQQRACGHATANCSRRRALTFITAPVLIDAHFFARGLMGRHLFALARDNLPVGVGIDEDAAVLISSDQQTWRSSAGGAAALIYTPPDARDGQAR